MLLDNMHTLTFIVSFHDMISHRDDYIQNTNARYITTTKTITKIKESLIAYWPTTTIAGKPHLES